MPFDATEHVVNIGEEVLAADLNDPLAEIQASLDENRESATAAKTWAVGPGTPPVSTTPVETSPDKYCAEKHADSAALSAEFAVIAETGAEAAKAAAIAASGATLWLIGTAYVIGDTVFGSDGHTYRCIVNSTGDNPVTAPDGHWTNLTGNIGRNLLINSNMGLDQRGIGTTLSSGQYGPDMFMCLGDGIVTFTIETNGDITIDQIENLVGTNTIQLWQRNDDIAAAIGKQVTVSLFVVSIVNPTWICVNKVAVQEITTTGWHSYTFTSTGESNVGLGNTIVGANVVFPGVSFNSWKVEEGSMRTTYQRPEPVAENNRCYKYFLKIGPSTQTQFVGVSRGVDVCIPTPVEMRALPDITIFGTVTVYDYIAVSSLAATTLTKYAISPLYVTATASGTGSVGSHLNDCFLGDHGGNYILLDANYTS